MDQQPFTLVGTAHPKPERAAELKELLLSFVEPTRQESGCPEYHFHEDRDEPGVFVFYEAWRSRADLDIRFLTMHSPYRPATARPEGGAFAALRGGGEARKETLFTLLTGGPVPRTVLVNAHN
ncbi:putative quinol monooxygenase [Streptomyces sp. NPDC056486]|uniref:putative quinol monooxygenase n=1 Tax=Streptomyces sp. NPDC056486 TaxID=3345835 RepID=UPI0036B3BF7A